MIALRAIPTISVMALACALVPAMALAKGAPGSAMAYDTGGLLQADAAQPAAQSATPPQAPPSGTQGAVAATPAQAYGGNPYDTGVSYAGEVQDGDPSSASLNRGNAGGRTPRSGVTMQQVDTTGGGDGDTALAPSALIPGQINAFGNGDLRGRKLVIRPYIEAQQIAYAPISPGGDVLTYSVLAAGVDGLVNTRNTQGAISLRYQRNFGWGRQAQDNDALNGIANFTTRIAGDAGRSGNGGLHLDYGGYAQRNNLYAGGASFGSVNGQGDALSQVYSVYAGPRYATQVGDVAVNAAYHAGYTAVNTTGALALAGANTLDHSLSQDARLSASTKPGDGGLPVGLTGEAGYYRQDVHNLDQKVEDAHARAGIIVPITQNLNAIGTAGYEHVQVSSRDAVRDANGNPVVDSRGRYVTDYANPRIMAFDTSGLIWDVGVQWRPNPRVSGEAHIGRRYGRLGGYGFFTWQPNGRTTFNVLAYENLTGFGGALTTALTAAPTSFVAIRDPISGGLTGCVGSFSGGGCVSGTMGALNSQIYRSRGVVVSGTHDFGHWQAGLAGGWEQRQYLGAPGTVLAVLNGKTDQYYWGQATLNGRLSQRSNVQGTLQLYRFESGLDTTGDTTGLNATALYNYYFTRHLSGNASAVITGIRTEQNDDLWIASGALGMRYSF